jgi:probable HAF family extracellular repeat protein
MRKNSVAYAVIFVCAVLSAGGWLSRTKAQDALASHAGQNKPRYKVVFTDTFGGPDGHVGVEGLHVLNNEGTFVGSADTTMSDPDAPDGCFNDTDCFAPHAFKWQEGEMTDLGTLPGGADSETTWITPNGLIAGNSRNGLHDPIVGGPEMHGVLWKHNRIIDLGTLDGGTLSLVGAVNSAAEVVGLSLTTIQDPFSMFGFYQTRAFRWKDGVMQDLGTLGGPDAMAMRINERGQIVGNSYIDQNLGACGLTLGVFFWEKGRMIDLGGFGGTCTFVGDLNNRGEVVGSSYLAGDQALHPFRWEHGRMKDLGTLGGNFGQTVAVNDAGDIVGLSTLPGNDNVFHAVLWADGHMFNLQALRDDQCSLMNAVNLQKVAVGFSVDCSFDESTFRATISEHGKPAIDLNTLIPANSGVELKNAVYINDRGEIAVVGGLSDGTHRPVLLIPCDDSDWENSRCENVGHAPHLGDYTNRSLAPSRKNAIVRAPRKAWTWNPPQAWRGARQ